MVYVAPITLGASQYAFKVGLLSKFRVFALTAELIATLIFMVPEVVIAGR